MDERINKFIYDEKGFIIPEKYEAVQIFGIEKAEEIWKKGPSDKFISQMRLMSCARVI